MHLVCFSATAIDQRGVAMKIVGLFFYFLSTSMNFVPSEFVDIHSCVPQKKISCLVDTYFPCPPDYYDGCLTNETSLHQCLPATDGPSCSLEMNLKCPTNFEDGCLSGRSDYHICLPVAGDLCSKKATFSCPSGFEDSCDQ